MSSRGRLIAPLIIEVVVLDKSSSASDRDDDLRSFSTSRPFGARGLRVSGKTYSSTTYRLRAQLEPVAINKMTGSQAGNIPDYRTSFIIHFRQLEKLNLVDATSGKPILEGARINAIYKRNGDLSRRYDDPPVHVIELREIGQGLGGNRNLLQLVTDDRPQGLETAP